MNRLTQAAPGNPGQIISLTKTVAYDATGSFDAGSTDDLQEIDEFLDAQPGLAKDRSQSAWLEIPPPMNGNGYRSARASSKRHDMMASNNPLDGKAGLFKRTNNLPSLQDRQTPACHAAATVTSLTSGGASSGMGSPCALRCSMTAKMASFAIRRASSSVSPSVTASGNAGTSTVKPPSS